MRQAVSPTWFTWSAFSIASFTSSSVAVESLPTDLPETGFEWLHHGLFTCNINFLRHDQILLKSVYTVATSTNHAKRSQSWCLLGNGTPTNSMIICPKPPQWCVCFCWWLDQRLTQPCHTKSCKCNGCCNVGISWMAASRAVPVKKTVASTTWRPIALHNYPSSFLDFYSLDLLQATFFGRRNTVNACAASKCRWASFFSAVCLSWTRYQPKYPPKSDQWSNLSFLSMLFHGCLTCHLNDIVPSHCSISEITWISEETCLFQCCEMARQSI